MLRLGTVAFGGPAAHLAHFQRECVEQRQWISSADYAELLAFCQVLPGPASSQVGMGLGLRRAGLPGMFAAWFGFSAPSVVVLLLLAAGGSWLGGSAAGWIRGLLAGVVAIVAHAVWQMGRKLCPDVPRMCVAAVGAVMTLSVPSAITQLGVIAFGAVCGLILLKPPPPENRMRGVAVGRGTQLFGWLLLSVAVLLPILWVRLSPTTEATPLTVYAAFAQAGALVFGGGHVVLPMLQAEVVAPGWMSTEQFLAGYGLTQAMPGPIFTLSVYLGSVIGYNLQGSYQALLIYAAAAYLGVFMPSLGFMAALYPLWHRLRSAGRVRQALQGMSAAVVGLLLAALYDPVWLEAVKSSAPYQSVAIALVSGLLLVRYKRPAWQVVGFSATCGALLSL